MQLKWFQITLKTIKDALQETISGFQLTHVLMRVIQVSLKQQNG